MDLYTFGATHCNQPVPTFWPVTVPSPYVQRVDILQPRSSKRDITSVQVWKVSCLTFRRLSVSAGEYTDFATSIVVMVVRNEMCLRMLSESLLSRHRFACRGRIVFAGL